jgi:RNA polymerase sigma factor (sigma-70 family)
VTDLGESQLVEMARAGDQDAFGQLYLQSLPQIKDVWYDMSRSARFEHDLDDFCQSVWLLALKIFNSFRGDGSFTTWIVQVAIHRALAILKRRKQPKNGDGRLVYQGPEMSEEQWGRECFRHAEDKRLEAATARRDVVRLMEIISPQYRELVQLHHLEGYTETEIAARTGLSVPAVRSRLSRAMVQLRKKVEKGANRNAPKISLTIQGIILREGESSE